MVNFSGKRNINWRAIEKAQKKAGPWLTLPLIYVPMLLLRLKAWGFSSAVSGGLAVAYQNNFYHDAQLDHLETRLNLIVFLTPQS